MRAATGGDLRAVLLDQFVADVAAERLGAVLDPTVARGDDLDRQAHADAVVAGRQAFGVVDRDGAAVLAVTGADLRDLVASGARGLVAGAQQLDLRRPARRPRAGAIDVSAG